MAQMKCREEMIRNNLRMQLNHKLNLNLENQGSGAYVAAQAAMAADALRSGAPALNPKIADQTQITDLYKKAWA